MPGDDLLVGRLIAEQGYEVRLLSYSVLTVDDFASVRDLFQRRVRWIVVMRHMRPWGHIGLVFTLGLPWSLIAVATHPVAAVAVGYLGCYFALRCAMTWLISSWGLRCPVGWKKLLLIPVWDATAALIWLVSFTRNTIRWRNHDYYLRDGQLVPADAAAIAEIEGLREQAAISNKRAGID